MISSNSLIRARGWAGRWTRCRTTMPPVEPRHLDGRLALEHAHRLAQGRARDAELAGEVALGRQLVTGREVALVERAAELLEHQLVGRHRSDGGEAHAVSMTRVDRKGSLV